MRRLFIETTKPPTYLFSKSKFSKSQRQNFTERLNLLRLDPLNSLPNFASISVPCGAFRGPLRVSRFGKEPSRDTRQTPQAPFCKNPTLFSNTPNSPLFPWAYKPKTQNTHQHADRQAQTNAPDSRKNMSKTTPQAKHPQTITHTPRQPHGITPYSNSKSTPQRRRKTP